MEAGLGSGGKFAQKDLSASKISTAGYDKFIEMQEEQLDVMYQQLQVADEATKAQIEANIIAKEQEVNKVKREKALINAVNNLNTTFIGKVNEAVQVLEENELKANTRLMGSNKIFSKSETTLQRIGSALTGQSAIMDTINKNLAVSPFVKQQDVIKNIAGGIAQGIVTNVELRGYLETIKDGIVSTFDAFDEKINKLVRI